MENSLKTYDTDKVHYAQNDLAIAISMMVSGTKVSDRAQDKKLQLLGNTMEIGSMIKDMEKALVWMLTTTCMKDGSDMERKTGKVD